ncbi:MAG: FecR family protein [Gallionella sp.]
MKKLAAFFVALALLPSVSSSAQAAGGSVYVVSGNVFAAQGKNPSHRVIGNEAIVSDTLINTGDKSAALLQFEDGQVVTMQANSSLHVREYQYDTKKIENSNIVFSMFKGGMRFITGLIGQRKKQAFRLLTPNATIGIRGTEFMVAMVDKSMYSQVVSGKIAMTNATGMTVLGAGQSAAVASSGALVNLVSASAIPAGTFAGLLAIPVNPSAITAPAPASIPAAPSAAAASAAASVAGAALGVAGIVGSDTDSTQAPPTEIPAATPQEPTEPAKVFDDQEVLAESKSGIALTGKIGTLGYGAELNYGFSDSLSARVGLNAYTYKYNGNSSSVNYDFKLELQTVSALADWYPFEGGFRTSAGLLYNNNKVSLGALPIGGNYTINGVTYTSAQIGSLQGEMSFNTVAPYLGIGWGNPVATDKGWGLVTDIGVLFQGKPKTSLTATCTPAPCPAPIPTDVAAENTKLENDLRNFKFWPVVSIGISYQW